ncbi:Hypp1426 [Branchiostoma lanceolatum]|uniref:Hypp1426 protein n=1 Tax=Branchiostoma lanceolatum TaxID=7740 RepID=A0A8K0EN89_BRALA|nr:Hypp1426 [Branchiostoma lanceolatum]
MVIYSTDRPWNYDCSFVAGSGRRKYFRQEVYMVFPPTFSSGHHGSAAYFTKPTASVRLKLNRSPNARRRNHSFYTRNFTIPMGQITTR